MFTDVKGYEGKYLVSEEGKIYSLKTERYLKEDIGCGYAVVKLNAGKKYKTLRVHRVVAEAFIPNPNNKKFVNHIDGNKLNNTASNLEWITSSENVKHSYVALQRTKPTKPWDFIEDDGKRWLPIFEKYEVSEDGQIRSRHKRKLVLIHQWKSGDGYMHARLYYNKTQKTIKVHRAVAMAFIPNPDGMPCVVHLNGNRTDNRTCNLKWYSSAMNTKNREEI